MGKKKTLKEIDGMTLGLVFGLMFSLMFVSLFLNAKIERLDSELEQRILELDQKIDKDDLKLFFALNDKIEANRNETDENIKDVRRDLNSNKLLFWIYMQPESKINTLLHFTDTENKLDLTCINTEDPDSYQMSFTSTKFSFYLYNGTELTVDISKSKPQFICTKEWKSIDCHKLCDGD